MLTDLADSGLDSNEMSREDSPTALGTDESPIVAGGQASDIRAIERPAIEGNSADDEFDDEDETLGERLWALTEMFPESIRLATDKLTKGSVSGTKWLYSTSRTVTWVLISSATILVAPVLFEMERSTMEDQMKQQQRQILLGPGAAMSGGLTPPAPQR